MMQHFDGSPCDKGPKDDSEICWAHTKIMKTPGQFAFEKWAEEFGARPVWYDLPYELKDKWEAVAKAVSDAFIESMVDAT